MLVLSQLIDTMPPLPQSSIALGRLKSDPNRSMSKMAAIVESDPLLMAKVLGVVNSSYYPSKAKVTTITHACAMLGENELYSLSLLVGLHRHFSFDLSAYGITEQTFLHNTLMQTKLMDAWLKKVSTRHEDNLRLAAFVSDIGKILINKLLFESGDFERFEAKLGKGIAERAAELDTIGASTLEATALILRHWQLYDVADILYYADKAHPAPDAIKTAVSMMESVHALWHYWKASRETITQQALMGFSVFDTRLMPLYEEALNQVMTLRPAS